MISCGHSSDHAYARPDRTRLHCRQCDRDKRRAKYHARRAASPYLVVWPTHLRTYARDMADFTQWGAARIAAMIKQDHGADVPLPTVRAWIVDIIADGTKQTRKRQQIATLHAQAHPSVSRRLLRSRLRDGWSPERATSTPKFTQRSHPHA